jgi:hypothetical protein
MTVRLSAVLLVLSLLGVIGGAWLIGRWAVGCAVIFDSVALGAWALSRDDGKQARPQAQGAQTMGSILEKYRDAS